MVKIYQLLPTIMLGDGVSQDAIEMEACLHRAGFYCRTYADCIIDAKLKKTILPFSQMPETSDDDIILYHLSTGSDMAEKIKQMKGKLVICYHNITPAHWFVEYDKSLQIACEKGRQDILCLKDRSIYCLADSSYNAQELKNIGYHCPIEIVPIVMNFERFGKNDATTEKGDSRCHVLFTGRIVPNKKIEDVIETFYYLKKYYMQDAVLDIVGNYQQDSLYYKKLISYVQKLGVEDCFFHGHVSEQELSSLYRSADIYVSLSEHEGFCIPLLEAMHFNIPVIAYNSGAVSETMQNAGILLDEKNPLVVAGIINYIYHDADVKKEILCEQIERIHAFTFKAKDNILIKSINKIIKM